MRLQGYRVRRVEENVDTNLETRKFSIDPLIEYHLFNKPITIFPDDTLTTCYKEEIKPGRRVNECIGYCTINTDFDTFLVKLIQPQGHVEPATFKEKP